MPTMSNRSYQSAYSGGIVPDADGKFLRFVRQVDASHLESGYWRFASEQDDRRAYASGFASPEAILLEQVHNDQSLHDIIIRWVPGTNQSNLKMALTGTATQHLSTIYELRHILGLSMSLRGQVPLYPVGDDPRLKIYWEKMYQSKQQPATTSATSPSSRPTASPSEVETSIHHSEKDVLQPRVRSPNPSQPQTQGPSVNQNIPTAAADDSELRIPRRLPRSRNAPPAATSRAQSPLMNNMTSPPSRSTRSNAAGANLPRNTKTSVSPQKPAHDVAEPQSRTTASSLQPRRLLTFAQSSRQSATSAKVPPSNDQQYRSPYNARSATPGRLPTWEGSTETSRNGKSSTYKSDVSLPSQLHRTYDDGREVLPAFPGAVKVHPSPTAVNALAPLSTSSTASANTLTGSSQISKSTSVSLRDSPKSTKTPLTLPNRTNRFPHPKTRQQPIATVPSRSSDDGTDNTFESSPSYSDDQLDLSMVSPHSEQNAHQGVARHSNALETYSSTTKRLSVKNVQVSMPSPSVLDRFQALPIEARRTKLGGESPRLTEPPTPVPARLKDTAIKLPARLSTKPVIALGADALPKPVSQDSALHTSVEFDIGLSCMDCGQDGGHKWDCHMTNLKPRTNLTILDYRDLAEATERFDPGRWTKHFDQFPDTEPEDAEAEIQGMADIIRNEESCKSNPSLLELADEHLILAWAFRPSGDVKVLEEDV